MRGFDRTAALVLLLAVASAGCTGGASKRNVVSTEPTLVPSDPEVAIVDRAKPATGSTVTVAERHPLIAKPKQYYDDTNSNKVGKTAAAAFLGVPAGIYGELKQIVVGAPASPPSY